MYILCSTHFSQNGFRDIPHGYFGTSMPWYYAFKQSSATSPTSGPKRVHYMLQSAECRVQLHVHRTGKASLIFPGQECGRSPLASNGPTDLLGIPGGRVGRRSYLFCTTSEIKIHAIALHDDSSLHAALFRLSDSTCRSRFLVETLKRGIFRRGEGTSVLRLPHTRTSDAGLFGA